MRLWIWRGLRLTLPDDWEMLQFSRNLENGRCLFADRYDFRFELTWRKVTGPPDFDRTVSDYASKLKDEGATDVEFEQSGQWRGIACRKDSQLTSRYGRHFSGESCLVELVFLWREQRDGTIEQEVLRSVAEEPEYEGKLRRWRAFGMDLLVPNHLSLRECVVQPANVQMTFSDDKKRYEERFARRGMVTEWLNGNVAEWLQAQIPDNVEVSTTTGSETAGHRMARLRGEQRLSPIAGMIRRPARCDAEAWQCPEDGRLYSSVRVTPAAGNTAGSKSAEPRLSCCARTRLPI